MTEILTTKMPSYLSPHDTHQVYNGLDAGITLEVWWRLHEELEQEILRSNYKNEEDYLNALKWQEGARTNYSFERAMQAPALAMMRRGILVDNYYRWEVVAQLEKRISSLQDVLNEFSCAVWGKPLNANSHHQLKIFFYEVMKLPEQTSYVKGQRRTSINRDALERLSIYFHAEPICNTIIRIRDLGKKLSVLRTEVDSDSRMRTSYNVAGPETGRWSSSSNVYGGGTNLQNITEELRRIFIADRGFKLAYIDLSQAESRCLAFLCYTLFGSTRYLDACESGDLHTLAATLIWRGMGWQQGDKKHDRALAEQEFYRGFSYRDMAKRGGHASNYYGKPFTIARHLKVPQQLIESFQSSYFDAFPELREYHKWCARELQLHGQISTPLLTTRHFFGRVNDDSTLREAIAHVPQHMVGVLLNLALWRVWHHLAVGPTPRVQILAQVHDAILLQYPEDEEEEILSAVLPLMATPLTFAERTMTIPSDILVGWNWAKYYDEEKAAEDERRGRKPKPLNLDGLRGGSGSESPIPARGVKTRRLGDWIDSFLDITSDAPSPSRFRLWAGITAISAAAEKRIWTRTGKSWQTEFDVFPSLYTLLVSPPAIGKGQAIGPVERIWHSAKGAITGRLKVAPRSMTKASLVDEMAKAQRHIPLNKFPGVEALSIEFLEYSSLAILAEELGVLISSHDLDFLSLLTEIYNSKAVYSETRRTNKLSVEVFNPQITFLGGTQPAFLASILPEEAWGMGAMSRIILIYSGTGVKKQLFPENDLFDNVIDSKMRILQRNIVSDFSQILDLYGEMKWAPAARHAAVEWTNAGMPPIPTHSKLVHYCGRRDLHVVKLSMIAALSRGNSLVVQEEDFRRAQGWMLEAEEVMPDVFREMTGKSDGELIKQLNFYMFSIWMRNGRKPMHESYLINFLITRTTSDRIERIISMAERANIIAREAGTNLWFPRRADEHGQVD